MKTLDYEKLVIDFGISLLIGLCCLVICLVVFIPYWDYIANLQRLCRLIYSAGFYIVNDIESPNMYSSSKAKVSKEIAYFPSFYYKVKKKKGIVEITIKLDGSKFHMKGDYVTLNETLEQLYAMSVVGVEERNGFYTYALLENSSKYRIGMDEVIPQGYVIPLMKHLVWDIVSTPHALVNGGTGGGKSYFINILIRAFILMGADIRIGDPKNADLADLCMIMPNVVHEQEEILAMLHEGVKEMNTRYRTIKEREDYQTGHDFSYYKLPPIVIIIDEYVALVDNLVKKEKDQFKSDLAQIVLKGRQAGVFIILATQRPDAEYLSGNVRDQLGLRVTLGKMSRDGYRMAFGTTDQKLRNKRIKGRGYLYVDGDDMISELYAPLVPPNYKFIEEFSKLLDVTPSAFLPSGRKASSAVEGQGEPTGDLEVKEVIYKEVKR